MDPHDEVEMRSNQTHTSRNCTATCAEMIDTRALVNPCPLVGISPSIENSLTVSTPSTDNGNHSSDQTSAPPSPINHPVLETDATNLTESLHEASVDNNNEFSLTRQSLSSATTLPISPSSTRVSPSHSEELDVITPATVSGVENLSIAPTSPSDRITYGLYGSSAAVLTPRVGPIPRLTTSRRSRTSSTSIPIPATSHTTSATQTAPIFATVDATGIRHGESTVGSSPHHMFTTPLPFTRMPLHLMSIPPSVHHPSGFTAAVPLVSIIICSIDL